MVIGLLPVARRACAQRSRDPTRPQAEYRGGARATAATVRERPDFAPFRLGPRAARSMTGLARARRLDAASVARIGRPGSGA
jgi:hypothetical protein